MFQQGGPRGAAAAASASPPAAREWASEAPASLPAADAGSPEAPGAQWSANDMFGQSPPVAYEHVPDGASSFDVDRSSLWKPEHAGGGGSAGGGAWLPAADPPPQASDVALLGEQRSFAAAGYDLEMSRELMESRLFGPRADGRMFEAAAGDDLEASRELVESRIFGPQLTVGGPDSDKPRNSGEIVSRKGSDSGAEIERPHVLAARKDERHGPADAEHLRGRQARIDHQHKFASPPAAEGPSDDLDSTRALTEFRNLEHARTAPVGPQGPTSWADAGAGAGGSAVTAPQDELDAHRTVVESRIFGPPARSSSAAMLPRAGPGSGDDAAAGATMRRGRKKVQSVPDGGPMQGVAAKSAYTAKLALFATTGTSGAASAQIGSDVWE